ncbi:hypothetical protein LTR36_007200 [Oleoguttula mirabilis]|uniref:BTB domain-containing protein n=1 Tax=Oleoguttula mirabilis TaxID=1507867 RepID=A0AAV9JA54_9PEZI|nr:hypothetical protein LTR36_007200 [Oleoguttula mirabilis]
MVSHHQLPPYAALPAPAPSAPPAPVTRASSVTSGRSQTRRHRHARTHHGGSSAHLAQNEFPVFSHTGDVEIIVTSANGRRENRYLLHRLILSQCSGFFEAGTRTEWSGRAIEAPPNGGLARISENDSVTAGGSSRASSQERRSSYNDQPSGRRWKYVLDWQAAGEEDAPMLVQKDDNANSLFGGAPPPVRNKPPASNEGFFRSVTNFSALNLNERTQASVPADAGDEVLKDYDNLFRTMYQYPPVLDSINIATAYTECKALLHLADMYDALEIVGSRVDHHLLRFGARLFKQIAKYPPSYLKLGYLARSRTIFTEAVIHVVGQWPLAAPQLRGQIDAAVMDLLEDKVDEVQEMQERIESKLWRLTLTTSRGDRVTPSNDYLSWLGISLFRQWLAENTTPAPASILKDAPPTTRPGSGSTAGQAARASSSRSSNHIASQRTAPAPPPRPPAPPPPSPPGKVYRSLGSTSPSAYLTHDDLKRFLKLQPDLYTRDNLRRLERRLDEIKNLARDAVKPLMRNFLELDLNAFGPAGLGYLTCARLEEADLPWDD